MAHSWNWLSPRSFVRLPANDPSKAKPVRRRCLPAIETLGDRVLLSVTPAAIAAPEPPDPCLVAEINGAIGQPGASNTLVTDEIVIQKLAAPLAGSTDKIDAALTEEFIKINNLFGGLDAALITGSLLPAVQIKYQTAISDEFVKIDALIGVTGVSATDSVNLLLPAVQHLQADADGLLTTLQNLAPGSGGSFKVVLTDVLLDASFTDLENNLISLNLDVTLDKVAPAVVDYFKIQLDEAFIKFLPPDPAIQASVQGAVTEADTIVADILQPPTTTVGTGPTGTTAT
jgi:hypothetical protein